MSELRFEWKNMLAADLGEESCVPDLLGERILQNSLKFYLDETDEKYSFINKDAIKEWKKSGVLPTQREIAGKYERNEASVSRTVKDFQKKLKKEL